MNEFGLIANYLAPLAEGPEALSLKDDAALIPGPAGFEYAVTKDALVEGVHFLPDTAPEDLARKVLGVNLSDMAAMGALPKYYLIAACLNPKIDEEWHRRFTSELHTMQHEYGCMLIGGDTVKHKETLSFAVTMIGEVPEGKALLRSGAKAGDDIWVSGTIGDAALGLNSDDAYLKSRYLRPQPRVGLGVALRGVASAAVDISDGLVADIGHLAHASGVMAIIEAADVPLSKQAKAADISTILTGGDDYELAFTAAPAMAGKVVEIAASTGVSLTRIGHITGGHGVAVHGADGGLITLEKPGFTHF